MTEDLKPKADGKRRLGAAEILVALLLVGIGIALLAVSCKSLIGLWKLPPVAAVNSRRVEIASWPAVKGQLDEICRLDSPSKHGEAHFYSVKYHYVVGGSQYRGDHLSTHMHLWDGSSNDPKDDSGDPATQPFGQNVWEREPGWIQTIPLHLSASRQTTRGAERVFVGRPETETEVHYDPKDVAVSVLDNRILPYSYEEYYGEETTAMLLMALFGSAMLILGIFVVIYPKDKAAPAAPKD